MKFDIVEKKENKTIFILSDITSAYANALRRTILSEVPTMAIEDVEIRKNSSALYDEIISHRLGLLPISTDLKSYVLPENCKCEGEGCAKCSLKLTLKAKGPKVVYASDIKSTDPKVKPVYPKTIIANITEDQELELEATAILGKGKVHTKWSPGLVFFKLKPEIKIDHKKVEDPKLVAESCPVDIFDVKSGKLSIKEQNLLKCHDCGACYDLSEGVEFTENEGDYIFNYESWGQLSPKETVLTAIDILDNKLKEVSGFAK